MGQFWVDLHFSKITRSNAERRCETLTFIAHKTAPVFLAGALPRNDACPVYAAGVWDTLVAELALPSDVAPEK